MPTVAVIYHSGWGHTKRLAEAIVEGATAVEGTEVRLHTADEAIDALDTLDDVDAMIFGSPTYMGGPSTEFKRFIDATGAKWFAQDWRDMLAGGFTVSGSYSGDKLATLQAFVTFAMQHGMVWIGQAEMPPATETGHGGAPEAVNRLGSFTGVMGQADNAAPEVSPPSGDVETARRYGRRVAEAAKRWRSGTTVG